MHDVQHLDGDGSSGGRKELIYYRQAGMGATIIGWVRGRSSVNFRWVSTHVLGSVLGVRKSINSGSIHIFESPIHHDKYLSFKVSHDLRFGRSNFIKVS